jgi:signal transduction histidine kinase
MNVPATVALSCAGATSLLVVHHTSLWWLRPSAKEYRAAAALALATILTEVGLVLSSCAPDAARALSGTTLAAAGRALTVTAFMALGSSLGRSRGSWAAPAYAVLTLGVLGTGLGYETSGTLDEPRATLVARALVLVGLALGTQTVVRIWRTGGLEHAIERIIVSTPPVLVAGTAALPSSASAALGSMTAVVAVAWVMLIRMTRVDVDLRQRRHEVDATEDSLRSARAELVKTAQLAAVGEVSAVIAHEIRNPLAVLKNTVTLLGRSADDPAQSESLLAIVDAEVDGLNSLVADLVAYGRPMVAEPRPVEIGSLVEQSIRLARRGIERPELYRFAVEIGPGWAIHGDPALLRHALMNILDNAIKAMPNGGAVEVRARDATIAKERGVAIDFHDEGEGMDTIVRRMARDPFFTTRATGTGLGLAIVERVARVHGGYVELASHEGSGTTVTLVLPKAVDRDSSPEPR